MLKIEASISKETLFINRKVEKIDIKEILGDDNGFIYVAYTFRET